MPSVARMMVPEDMEQVMALNKGDFPPNFLSVVYERDGKILGWVCCSVEGKSAVAHGAVSRKMSAFGVKRLAESFESFLRSLGLYFYVFGVHVRRKRWVEILEGLGIYEKYATRDMYHWFKRRLR